MAKKDPTKPAKKKGAGRIKQIRQTYTLTKKTDPKIGLILLGVFLGAGVVAAAALYLFQGNVAFSVVFGVLVGILAALIVFGRRGQHSAISQIEGKPGAAAAVLGMLRRGWKIDPGIAFNKQQDVVHRVVGPPGIILVGEGNPNRLKSLLSSERRKHERVASETRLSEVIVGDGEGQVPLRKLVRNVSKRKKALKPSEMTDVLARLKALDANRSNIPLPKGPIPTSMKGSRQNMRGR